MTTLQLNEVILMAYRANGSYLRFKTRVQSTTIPPAAGQAMDNVISGNHRSKHLQDEPCVKKNQNVYDSLAE
jgi:hypothetical protein